MAAVLDASYSSSGSSVKKRRPLAVALACSALLRQAAGAFVGLWTSSPAEDGASELLLSPRGQTDLATPLLQALAWRPDLVVIISDGFENDPPGAVQEIVRVFRKKIDRDQTVSFVHANPVFDERNYAPRTLGPSLPTVGLRNAEDLPTALGFARFADGSAPLADLEAHLASHVHELIGDVVG